MDGGAVFGWYCPSCIFSLCLAIALGGDRGQGSWRWFPVFYADFPFSVLLLPLMKFSSPFVVLGVAGTLWWFALNALVVFLVEKVFGIALTASRRGA